MLRLISDLLCMISTGGSFEKRKLYSDEDITAFPIHNPVILTGISNTGEREDLLDRSLVVTPDPISDEARRPKAEIEQRFNVARPQILGVLYTIIAASLAKMHTVEVTSLPRMTDFAVFATACEETLGWPTGTACRILSEACEDAVVDVVSHDPFAQGVIEQATQKKKVELTVIDWMAMLNTKYPSKSNMPGWPRNPKVFSERFTRLIPQLRCLGFEFSKRQSSNTMKRELSSSRRSSNQIRATHTTNEAGGRRCPTPALSSDHKAALLPQNIVLE